MPEPRPLDDADRARYEWQLPIAGFGESGQAALKGASVLISRCGGVGGTAAYQLAAAGVGRLVLAHAGPIQVSDLNRQLLMTTAAIGRSRMESARARLRELNPSIVIETVEENVQDSNAARLVGEVDLVISAAPRFGERLWLNREAVRQMRPLVDAAMYELDAQLTTVLPGRSPCLACLYPEEPPAWNRRFPVFGAVAGMIGSLAALEAIKVLTGFAEPLVDRMLLCDLRSFDLRLLRIRRRSDCSVCGGGDAGTA
jgi:molybdopterin/thiamine biosynthesis adenylyltransferase